MQFIFLDELKSFSGYSDVRGVRNWLDSMHVQLIRVGKRFAADKDAFEQALEEKYGVPKRVSTYCPLYKTEKEFIAELYSFLSSHEIEGRHTT